MEVIQRITGRMANFTYLIADPPRKVAAVIDPSFGAQELEGIAAQQGWRIVAIFNTHHHFDHVQDNARLSASTGAPVLAHAATPLEVDRRLPDGATIEVGQLRLRLLHTPGHSVDSACVAVEDHLFTGDTLFVGECGRCDLAGSDPGAMWHSLHQVLRQVPDSTKVCPGHDYGEVPISSMGRERTTNYTLQPRTREEFVRFVLTP